MKRQRYIYSSRSFQAFSLKGPPTYILNPLLRTLIATYRIYSNKCRGADLIFRASSAALNRGRRFFKNWTLHRIFICTKNITVQNRSTFLLSPTTSFGTFQWSLRLLNSDLSVPFCNITFLKNRHFQ